MRMLKKLRYQVFLLSLGVGCVSLVVWVSDYCVFFRPSWKADTADRILGFGPWIDYLGSGRGLSLVGLSVLGLWLACLMWLLPGKLSDCREL